MKILFLVLSSKVFMNIEVTYFMWYAAGADIKEMEELQFKDVYMGGLLSQWARVSTFTKPIIAAVNGYAVSTYQHFSCISSWTYTMPQKKFPPFSCL